MTVPKDGTDAFYEGFDLENNPFPGWDQRFEEWDRDFLETANEYVRKLKSQGIPFERKEIRI